MEASYPPVSINVLPAQTPQTPRASVAPPSPPGPFRTDEHPVILGPRETAVREYCKWLESKAPEEAYKADFRRVCEVTLGNLMDLELILKNPDPSFFIERGIKPGTALHFVGDISQWAKHVKTIYPLRRGQRTILIQLTNRPFCVILPNVTDYT